MSYRKEIYEAAMAELSRRRATAEATARRRREVMTARVPRLAIIEDELRDGITQVAVALAEGKNPAEFMQALSARNLALQAEMAQLLHAEGCDFSDFEPPYTCSVCGDTGYTDSKMCTCLASLIQQESCSRLSAETGMTLTDFDGMQLKYYPNDSTAAGGRSPRAHMADVIEYGKQYAAHFGTTSPSLLLRGPTGVGKTHFSLAIARAVAEKGLRVVYGSAQTLLHRLEREHFGRLEGDTEQLLCSVPLLVLDDLGVEFASPFYTAELYNVINSRILAELPTIISTNLTSIQLKERYGDAISSRVVGHYVPLLFVGNDIRQIKAQENMYQ